MKSTTDNYPTPETPPNELPELPQPSFENHDAVVENVYPNGGHDRDRTSQRRMVDYLKERMLRKEIADRAVTLTVPNGEKTSRSLKRDGWWITPRQAIAASLLSFAAFNIAGNANELTHDTETAVAQIGDRADELEFYIKYGAGTPDQEITFPGDVTVTHLHGSVHEGTRKPVGTVAANQGQIDTIVRQVENLPAYKDGGVITSIVAKGKTSDDWANDSDLSVINSGNTTLGGQRSKADAQALGKAFDKAGVAYPHITTSSSEILLSPQEKSAIESLAKKSGYPSASAAIIAADRGEKLPTDLANEIKTHIQDKRGTEFDITITGSKATKTPDDTKFVPGIHPPQSPDRDYDGLDLYPFLPIPPIPRLRIMKRRIQKTKEVTFMERGTPEWIHLYRDALNEDGNLKRDLAWYTRKMSHLLRDDRIKTVDTATITGMDGAERSIRTCFVDHEPNDSTLQRIREVIDAFARANEGTIPDSISTIMIYPSENAGLEHGDPKKIGLGIDTQEEKYTLGTTTPLLGLIEMHMSTNPTTEELDSFFGGMWTLGHEMGHAADIDPSKPQKLMQLADGRYVSTSTWRGIGQEAHDALKPLPRRSDDDPIQFKITRQVLDRDGKLVPRTDMVAATDPRMAEAHTAQIVGRRSTRYGSETAAEDIAETAAALATGIEIPYSQTGERVPQSSAANFAKGYRPPQELIKAYNDAVGMTTRDFNGTSGRTWFQTSSPKDDPILHEIAKRERDRGIPHEDDMLKVLGWVVGD